MSIHKKEYKRITTNVLQEMKQKAVDANNEAETVFWDRKYECMET